MQSRVPKYNGDPHGPDGKLLSNFIPFAVLKSQNGRIYNDEVTRPDEKFITDRVVKYLAPKWDYWCGKAMTSWANLLPTI